MRTRSESFINEMYSLLDHYRNIKFAIYYTAIGLLWYREKGKNSNEFPAMFNRNQILIEIDNLLVKHSQMLFEYINERKFYLIVKCRSGCVVNTVVCDSTYSLVNFHYKTVLHNLTMTLMYWKYSANVISRLSCRSNT